MKSTLILLSAFLFTFNNSQLIAQNAGLKGSLNDPYGKEISFANIALYKSQDSSLYKVEASDAKGNFQFSSLVAGNYFIRIPYVGMNEFKQSDIILKEGETLNLGVINMNQSSILLQGTTVSAQRALLEVKPDRTVFNIEGTINSIGSDAISLLRKAPGVTVDNNDNINLLGRAGVLVYLDGKKLPLNGQELSNYLQSLNAEQIDRIEIITNPGAQYEAQGNGGIIDIRLKRDKNLGANGSINANYIQGKYPKSTISGNGNYRNKAVNVFGTGAVGIWKGFNKMEFESYQNDLYLEEININKHERLNGNFRLGTDYFLSKKHTLGLLVGGSWSDGSNTGENRIDIALADSPSAIDSILVAETYADNPRNHQTYNLNYRYEDQKKRSLNIDADYGIYKNENKKDQTNRYFDASEQNILTELENSFDSPSDIDIMTFKLDYEQNAFAGKFGIGSKLSRVSSDNTYLVYDGINGSKILNLRQSNKFKYVENVYAAYVNYATNIKKKWNINIGLRAEQTDATGDLQAFLPELQEPPVDINHLDFFPSAGLSWQFKPTHNLSLNYSRRINRPDYHVLNPFNNQLSQLSFEKGNPNLRPEIVNNVEMAYTLNYKYNFKFGYSLTTDQITRLIGPDDKDPRASFINWDNLAEQKIWSFSASLPFEFTKIWDAYFNLSGSHIDNQADYGNGAIVDLQAFTYSIFQQHSFDLPLGLKAEVSGYYSGPGIWGGVFLYESSWSIDLGLQKKFFKDRLNVKLSASDIFYESGWEGVSIFDGMISYGRGNWDSQRLSVNFSYLFGNENVKSRKRKTGLEDEAGRVGE